MNVNGDRVAGDSACRHGHLNYATACRGAGASAGAGGRSADGEVGDASRAVAVPGASANGAGGRDVREIKVTAAVVVFGDADRSAMACSCGRREKLSGLAPGKGDTRGLRLEVDGRDLIGFWSVTLTIAIGAYVRLATRN